MIGSNVQLQINKEAADGTWYQDSCIFEISWKVVFFEIFLHWFKCTNYSLYDMNFFSKNTTGNTIYLLYLGQ